MRYRVQKVTYMSGGRIVTRTKHTMVGNHDTHHTHGFPTHPGYNVKWVQYRDGDDHYQGHHQGYMDFGPLRPITNGRVEWTGPSNFPNKIPYSNKYGFGTTTCKPVPPPTCQPKPEWQNEDLQPKPPARPPVRDTADKEISPRDWNPQNTQNHGSNNGGDGRDVGFPYGEANPLSWGMKAVARQFHHEYDMTPGSLTSFKIIAHTKRMFTQSEISEIQKVINDSREIFEARIGSLSGADWPRKTVDLYLFNNPTDYNRAMGYFGQQGSDGLAFMSQGKLYVSLRHSGGYGRDASWVRDSSLAHELNHFFLHYATRGHLELDDANTRNDGDAILHEGIGEYLGYLVAGGREADRNFHSRVDEAISIVHSNIRYSRAETLDDLNYISITGGNGMLRYNLGFALVKYWEEKHPGVVRDVIMQLSKLGHNKHYGRYWDVKEKYDILEKINRIPADFMQWLESQASHRSATHNDHPDTGWTHGGYVDTVQNAKKPYVSNKEDIHKVPAQAKDSPQVKYSPEDKAKAEQIVRPAVEEEKVSGQKQVECGAVSQQDSAKNSSDNVVSKNAEQNNAEHETNGQEYLGGDNKTDRMAVAGPPEPSAPDTSGVGEQQSTRANTESDRFKAVEDKFDHTYTVTSKVISGMNIELSLRSVGALDERTITRAERIIKKTARVFEEDFGMLPKSDTPRKVEVWIHDNKPALIQALDSIGEDKNAGGMAWPAIGKVYVAKLGKTRFENLSHEVAHQLMYYASNGAFDNAAASQFLLEGVAEYVQHRAMLGRGVTLELSTIIDRVNRAISQCPDLQGAKSFQDVARVVEEHKGDPTYQGLQYSLGGAFVKYAQDTQPELLRGLFRDAAESGKNYATLPQAINALLDTQFTQWLSEHGVSGFVQKYEMLTPSMVDYVGYSDVVIDNAMTRVKVYTARLEDSKHETVGALSAVVHKVVAGNITAFNPQTGDGMSVAGRYHYLKPVNTSEGLKYVYSDAVGREYFASQNRCAVKELATVMVKYDADFAKIKEAMTQMLRAEGQYRCHETDGSELSQAMKSMCYMLKKAMAGSDSKIEEHLSLIEQNTLGHGMRQASANVDTIKEALSSYVTAKAQALLSSPAVGTSEEAVLARVLKSLIYIDPDAMIGRDSINFRQLAAEHPNSVFAVMGAGKGGISGVSVYKGSQKVGELPSNSEMFVEYADKGGNTVTKFIVADILKHIHTTYNGTPVVVVTQDSNGNKVANFVTGTKSGSLGDDEIELAVNQFIDLQTKGIPARDDFPLSQGIKIATYQEGAPGAISGPALIRKSALVDDRGTDRTSDDVYDATVKDSNNNKVLVEKMLSVQFYMVGDSKDAAGNVIDKSELVMQDAATSEVMQFPESITHLKLVVTSNGTRRLLPCTKDGDTTPPGMPAHFAKYAYIDPVHTYDRIGSEWVTTQAPFKMIDFGKYTEGTLFELRFDPNDPSIRRDQSGKPIDIGNQQHTSRVGIFSPEGAKIGELSSAVSFFQGDLFLSYDHNYSQSDFVSSLHHHEASVEDVSPGIKRVSLSGESAATKTDSGYSDYYAGHQREKQDDTATLKELHELAGAKTTSGSVHSSILSMDDARVTEHVSPTLRAATEQELSMLKGTLLFMVEQDNNGTIGKNASTHSFNVYSEKTSTYVSYPDTVTHMKVVTHEGQKHLVPCTADGDVSPEGMPNVPLEQMYINPILVHTGMNVERSDNGAQTKLSLVDLEAYKDGDLLELRVGGEMSYSPSRVEKDGDAVRTAHLYDTNGKEVGIMPMSGLRPMGELMLEEKSNGQIFAHQATGVLDGQYLIDDGYNTALYRVAQKPADDVAHNTANQQEELRITTASRLLQSSNTFEDLSTSPQEHAVQDASSLSEFSIDNPTGQHQGHGGGSYDFWI